LTAPWVVAFIVLWIAVISTMLLALGLIKRVGPALEALESAMREGLVEGSKLPAFEAVRASGEVLSAEDMKGVPGVILFLSPGCQPCERIADELRGTVPQLVADLYLVVPDTEEGRRATSGLETRVLYQRGNSVSKAFATNITPHAFAIDSSGVIVGQRVPGSVQDLERLAEQTGEAAQRERRTRDEARYQRMESSQQEVGRREEVKR
jgi:peroxiredoxin